MKISIAHEAPISAIPMVGEKTEFDFAIAPYALEYPEYALAYCNRPKGRILIMDNGKFELGVPLPVEDVLKAAHMTNADYIVSPDFIGDFDKTKRQLDTYLELGLYKEFKLACVVVGRDSLEQAACYEYYTTISEISMYCISFLTNRPAMLSNVQAFDRSKPHHLLGFDTVNELKACIGYLKMDVTLDTMKPVNATACNAVMSDAGRGMYKRPPLDVKLNAKLLETNLWLFRQWIAEIENA